MRKHIIERDYSQITKNITINNKIGTIKQKSHFIIITIKTKNILNISKTLYNFLHNFVQNIGAP